MSSLILERIGKGSEKGVLKAYAIDLGRLAEAMEGVGLTNEAITLWQEAAKVLGYKDIEKPKSFVSGLHKIEADAGFDSIETLKGGFGGREYGLGTHILK